MWAYWTLVKRELGSYFGSWIGYVVMSLMLLLFGLSFALIIYAMNNEAIDMPVTEVVFSSLYFWFVLALITPVMTMRTFAHEKATGTFETLMTTPVRDVQVMLAKFSGAMIFYLITWMPLIVCLVIISRYANDVGTMDLGVLGATYLGVTLLGALFLSMGCLASALTRSQIIAVMCSTAMGLFLWMLSFLSLANKGNVGFKAQLLDHMGLIRHMEDFASGVVDSRPVILYLSLTVFFLFLTMKVLESRRWK